MIIKTRYYKICTKTLYNNDKKEKRIENALILEIPVSYVSGEKGNLFQAV